MSLHISISETAERLLREKAAAAGQEVAMYAAGVLERSSGAPFSLAEISGDLPQECSRLGLSEDQVSQLLEDEKHAMRADRRKKAS